MNIYTTCAACGFLQLVADPDHSTHPNCAPADDAMRDLERAWLDHVRAGENQAAERLATIIDAPPPPPRLADAALHYASWGWPVFPLMPGGKTPLTRHGFKDATTDPGRIRRWWGEQPRANVGLPTGHAFDVIDVDAPKGWQSLWQMQDADAIPDVHGVATTAGAGLHLYVRPFGDTAGNLAGVLPGIDIRGTGGYVVAPPSIDQRGIGYAWRHRPSPIITAATATQDVA